MAGIDKQTAERLVQGAHAICPYSNAIRSNVDVKQRRCGDLHLGPVSPDRSISYDPSEENCEKRYHLAAWPSKEDGSARLYRNSLTRS
jgi:hypothetical protein